jgi:WD40 repeat protein
MNLANALLQIFVLVASGTSPEAGPKTTEGSEAPRQIIKRPSSTPHDGTVRKASFMLSFWDPEDTTRCCFSPDGKVLAVSWDKNAVRLFDTATWKPIRTLSGHRGHPVSLAFSPDGRLLAVGEYRFPHKAGANKGDVVLWDVSLGKKLHRRRLGLEMVSKVGFSPDGGTLATRGYKSFNNALGRCDKRVLQRWDLKQNMMETIRITERRMAPQARLILASDNRFALRSETAWQNMRIKVEQLQRPRRTGELSARVEPQISPCGKYLLTTGCANGAVEVQVRPLSEFRTAAWKTKTGSSARARLWRPPSMLTGAYADVGNVALFSPDGRLVATASSDQRATKIQLLDAPTGKLKREWQLPRADYWQMAFSADGRTLTVAASRRKLDNRILGTITDVAQWQIANGRQVFCRSIIDSSNHWGIPHLLRVSRSGGRIALARFSTRWTAKLRINTWSHSKNPNSRVHDISPVPSNTLSLEFSPDERVLLAGTEDRSIWKLCLSQTRDNTVRRNSTEEDAAQLVSRRTR